MPGASNDLSFFKKDNKKLAPRFTFELKLGADSIKKFNKLLNAAGSCSLFLLLFPRRKLIEDLERDGGELTLQDLVISMND